MALNVVFVCSRNQWRSPTAARVFANDSRMFVRACGLSDKSPRRLTAADLAWADLVLVMEAKHRSRIREHFRQTLGTTPIHVLDIPDDFGFMDPALIAILEERVERVMLGYDHQP